MRLRHYPIWVLFLALLAVVPGCASVPVDVNPWPAQAPDSDMMVVQFIDLEFKLPRAMVGRVIVHGVGSPSLSILRSPDNSNNIIVLGKADDFWEIYGMFEKKGFFEGLDIHNAESFFDSLFIAPGSQLSASLKIMRDVFSVEDAAYTKSAKGAFTVYRIYSQYPAANRLYILIDGEKSVYEMMGHISDTDYEALLAGMARSSVH